MFEEEKIEIGTSFVMILNGENVAGITIEEHEVLDGWMYTIEVQDRKRMFVSFVDGDEFEKDFPQEVLDAGFALNPQDPKEYGVMREDYDLEFAGSLVPVRMSHLQ